MSNEGRIQEENRRLRTALSNTDDAFERAEARIKELEAVVETAAKAEQILWGGAKYKDGNPRIKQAWRILNDALAALEQKETPPNL